MTIQPFDSIVHALAVLKTGPGDAELYGDGVRGVVKNSDGDCTIEVVDSLAIALGGMEVATSVLGAAAIVVATEIVDATHVRVRTLSAVTGAPVGASCTVMIMHRAAPLVGGSAGPVGPGTPAPLVIWWDSVAGSDANDGLTETTPVQTFARVAQFLPQRNRPVEVKCASGIYDVAPGVPSTVGNLWSTTFYADPDWDPRGDLFVQVATGAAGVGTTGETCILPAPVIVNEYECKSLRFLDGPALGQMRTIAQHPTTAITPTKILNPAPVAGNAYQVFTSNAVLRCTGGRLAFDGAGSAGGINSGPIPAQALSFVNFDLDPTATSGAVVLGTGLTAFYGVRLNGAAGITLTGQNTLLMGTTYTAGQGWIAQQLGLPQHLWDGWGVACDNANASISTSAPGTYVDGFIVGKGAFGTAGRAILRGGSMQVLNSFNQGSNLRVLGASATLPFQFGATTRGNSVINFAVTSGQAGIISMNNCVLRHSGSGTALLLQGSLVLILEPTVTGEAPGAGLTISVSRGARVFCTGALNLGRAAVADIQVESLAAVLKTALTAAGATSILADPTFPGSSIRRYA